MTSRERSQRKKQGPTFTGFLATAALAYGAYKLGSWAYEEYKKDKKAEDEQRIRDQAVITGQRLDVNSTTWRLRRQRMARARDEMMRALEGFLPTIRRVIEERTNIAGVSRRLKELRSENGGEANPKNKKEEEELWEIIKLRSLTRLIATAYAHTIVFLVLTVQVNLLGGRLYHEQMENVSSTNSISNDSIASQRMASYQQSHRFVLQHTYEYFFDRGLKALVGSVERAIGKVMEGWNVFDPKYLEVSSDMLQDCIRRVRQEMEPGHALAANVDRRGKPRSLMRFLMPPSANIEVDINDELASSILDETFDLLESPVLDDAQQDCLDETFLLLAKDLESTAFVDESGKTMVKPLAALLTSSRKSANTFYQAQEEDEDGVDRVVNIYSKAIESLPSVLELADVSFN